MVRFARIAAEWKTLRAYRGRRIAAAFSNAITATINSPSRSTRFLKIPIFRCGKWLMAFALLCSAKKGISALELQRELELGSYRTAWHLCHRIRHAMSKEPLAGLLKGTVEVDETYVGGKPRPGAGEKPKRGRGTKKTPVLA